MGAVVAVLLEPDGTYTLREEQRTAMNAVIGEKDVVATPFPSAFWLTTARQHTSGVAPCTNQKPRAAATRHDWQ